MENERSAVVNTLFLARKTERRKSSGYKTMTRGGPEVNTDGEESGRIEGRSERGGGRESSHQ